MWPRAGQVESLPGHFLGAYGSAFSPDGQRLATGGTRPRDAVILWDLGAQRELLSLQADGNTLAATSVSGNAHLWHAPSWEEIEETGRRQKSP
jgi:WD40 repeat protein